MTITLAHFVVIEFHYRTLAAASIAAAVLIAALIYFVVPRDRRK
jgi:hypothetical protein